MNNHLTTTWGDDSQRIREKDFDPNAVATRESLFALGNGFLGVRGDFEEGYPATVTGSIPGTYLNGFYLRRPIEYGESAPGFPRQGDYMPSILNARALDIVINGQALNDGKIVHHQRVLDMEQGHSRRETHWRMPSGAKLAIIVQSLIPMEHDALLAQHIELKALNQSIDIQCSAWLKPTPRSRHNDDDPRLSNEADNGLQWLRQWRTANFLAAQQGTGDKNISCLSSIHWPHGLASKPIACEEGIGQRIEHRLLPGRSVVIHRYSLYGDDPTAMATQLAAVEQQGFSETLRRQTLRWRNYWAENSITIDSQPALEQGLRFNQFHLRQSCRRDGHGSIAAKGLSGPGYDGHYFWDAEIYALPFFLFSEPALAKAMLRYRISKLDEARQRAREMSHPRGALYPWRTIGGGESSAYFPAGAAQYHINADIAYALWLYSQMSGDTHLIMNEAAPMLFETARIWLDLGHFNPQREGQFTIHEVTGPDEYTALVDNNYYTNLLAAHHLQLATDIAGQLLQEQPQRWLELSCELNLGQDEISQWRKAAEQMYLPQDQARDLSLQDDAFMQRPTWDKQRFPWDETPLLLKHHPMVLYRHQILKQADVLMAHYLLPRHSSHQRKANDYHYYEPLTTHDSSLSPLVHSVLAAWLGHHDQALDYFHMAVRTDLDDLHDNTHHGVHIASMAGSLACIHKGFAGIDMDDDELCINPILPSGWTAYRFHLHFRGRLLDITVNQQCRVDLLRGQPLTIKLKGETLKLEKSG